MNLKFAIYNFLFATVFPFLLPGFLLRMARRGGYRERILDRFAIYPRDLTAKLASEPSGSRVWIHAVSVGEVAVAGQLMREWRKADPTIKFVFSTTSSTGWRVASREITGNDELIYNPLDFPNFVKSALKVIRPKAVVLTESEIWPVFIRSAKKMRIPLFLINARVSDRSAPRYAKAKWFFKDIFSCFARIFAQSELDRERLIAAGADESRVQVTGSFKFDVATRKPEKEKVLREWIGEGKILLGGSTWPGEDEILLEIYRDIIASSPRDEKPILVLAPRHFEKADQVEENIKKAGFCCVRRSRDDERKENSVFLADTTGELMGLYGISFATFVGKSLCEHGSQNMIEPCACGVPTAVGPFTENFRPVMSELLRDNAIIQVANKDELAMILKKWFSSGDEGLGSRARDAVAKRCGVVATCVNKITNEIIGSSRTRDIATSRDTKSRKKFLIAIISLLVATLLAIICFVANRDSEKNVATRAEEYRNPSLDIVVAHIARMEKADAKSVYLADEEAERYRDYFERAGLSCATNGSFGRFKLVFLARENPPRDWKNLLDKMTSDGAMAWALDLRKKSAKNFRDVLTSFPCATTRLWMPGESDWLLTGHREQCNLKLDVLLDAFSVDSALDDLAKANCDSLPELYANYVGLREEILPAFQGDLATIARPECFITRDVPEMNWLSKGDVDEDIWKSVRREIRTFQIVRRKIVEGNMLAVQKDGINDAIDKWYAAIKQNPHDTMLLDRLYRLSVNARAFEKIGQLKGAAKCYETMISIRPTDSAAMMQYASIMKRLGYKEIANAAFDRAKSLLQKHEEKK